MTSRARRWNSGCGFVNIRHKFCKPEFCGDASVRLLSSNALLLLLFITASILLNVGRADERRQPGDAIAGLDVTEGLEVSLLAAEPMLLSPSNIDVDHLGRIWVCEVVNYRHFANRNNPAREAGDRILVLEDTNGDGTLDKQTTFYQGRDIDSAHGVCVLGNRVIVSAGENVFSFHDDDGDLKSDRKDVLFTGIKGTQHDHGIHSFTFGPDGRLYFNFGNAGKELHRPDGSLVVDVAGHQIKSSRQPYQEGMAFRCELDGSKVDTLGWNFRNNWELCVDSYGTVWQSDNDDDGNKAVRINYVMEYGNYGYKDEFTGAGWRDPRSGWEDNVPERHWHLNDPGVVPNVLHTGAGSPTGIAVYEGDLLPKRFHSQLIHCDAGPNIVRSYAVSKDGAGYKAKINNILTGARDQWFRPSDVCVAPDGSLIIADWYDPGVGGHRQGDIQRGRLFRVAPPGSKYTIKNPDFSTLAGAAEALQSPNVATRYLAYQKLKAAGEDAEDVLAKLFNDDSHPHSQARALWLLGQIDGQSSKYIGLGCHSTNSDLRITALRIARRVGGTHIADTAKLLATDESPQVRREVAIALKHGVAAPQKAKIWAQLAASMPSHDRWYLEALGIAAEGDWDNCLSAITATTADGSTVGPENVASVVWRSRGRDSARQIVQQILTLAASAADHSGSHLQSYIRALDFQPKSDTSEQIQVLLQEDSINHFSKINSPLVIAETLQRLTSNEFQASPNAKSALDRVLAVMKGTPQFIQLVQRFQLKDRYAELLTLAQENPDQQIGVEAIRALLRNKEWGVLADALRNPDTKAAVAIAQAMGNSLDGSIGGVLVGVIKDHSVAIDVRREAVRGATNVNYAAAELVKVYENNGLPPELNQTLAAGLHAAQSRGTRALANRLFPLPAAKEGTPLPAINKLIGMKGDAVNGRLVFNTTGTCHKCHVVNKVGREIGPNLSEIGSKLSREAMFESVIFPSAGISHNYEAYTVLLTSGITVAGLITSETDTKLSIQAEDGLVRTFLTAEIEDKVKQKISLMPADLQKVMTAQELIDVVAYMQTLKKK